MACRADSVKARPTSLDARRRLHEAGFSLMVDTGLGVVAPADLRRLCPGVRRATCLAGGAPAQVRRSVATGIPSRARCCTRRRHSGRRRRLTAERASGHGHQTESGGDAFCGSVSADGQGRCDQRGFPASKRDVTMLNWQYAAHCRHPCHRGLGGRPPVAPRKPHPTDRPGRGRGRRRSSKPPRPAGHRPPTLIRA
jgi:hypothetical protein